jgi:hypothetical protein
MAEDRRVSSSRTDGRRTRLLAAMAAQERVPLRFGRSDCLMRLADTVEAMTGVDHGARFRGRYSTLRGAYRVLKQAGFDGPIAFLTSPEGAGLKEIHPSAAMDGDIGAIMQDGHWAFGHIVGGDFFPAGTEGTAILPRSRVERAFEVA